jgi:hypothetical protein
VCLVLLEPRWLRTQDGQVYIDEHLGIDPASRVCFTRLRTVRRPSTVPVSPRRVNRGGALRRPGVLGGSRRPPCPPPAQRLTKAQGAGPRTSPERPVARSPLAGGEHGAVSRFSEKLPTHLFPGNGRGGRSTRSSLRRTHGSAAAASEASGGRLQPEVRRSDGTAVSRVERGESLWMTSRIDSSPSSSTTRPERGWGWPTSV